MTDSLPVPITNLLFENIDELPWVTNLVDSLHDMACECARMRHYPGAGTRDRQIVTCDAS